MKSQKQIYKGEIEFLEEQIQHRHEYLKRLRRWNEVGEQEMEEKINQLIQRKRSYQKMLRDLGGSLK